MIQRDNAKSVLTWQFDDDNWWAIVPRHINYDTNTAYKHTNIVIITNMATGQNFEVMSDKFEVAKNAQKHINMLHKY